MAEVAGVTSRGEDARGEPLKLACDAMLGGAARWLRAYGYETFWVYHIEDGALVALAMARGMVLITADRALMQRRVVTSGALPALYIPYGLSREAQLRLIIQRLGLIRRSPRCMACGGPLQRVGKASVWARIPTKTRQWLDDYWVCGACGRLFWRGTHWQRIAARLAVLERESGVAGARRESSRSGIYSGGEEASPEV